MPGFEFFGEEEKKEVQDVLDNGVLMRYGFDGMRNGHHKAKELEIAFAKAMQCDHAQVVSSGTAALTVALAVAGIGAGAGAAACSLELATPERFGKPAAVISVAGGFAGIGAEVSGGVSSGGASTGCVAASTGGASAGCDGVMIAGVSGTDVAPRLRLGNPAEVVPASAVSRATGAGSGVCAGALLAAGATTSAVGCS